MHSNDFSFFPSTPHIEGHLVLSKIQLEMICCLFSHMSSWRSVFNSLQEENYSFQINDLLTVELDFHREPLLALFLLQRDWLNYLKRLHVNFLQDDSKALMFKKALDRLLFAKSLKEQNNEQLDKLAFELENLIKPLSEDFPNIVFEKICEERVEYLSNELPKYLQLGIKKELGCLELSDSFSVEGFFAAWANQIRGFNTQLLKLPYSVEKWCTILQVFSNNILMKKSNGWQTLYQAFEKISLIKQESQGGVSFFNTLTMWAQKHGECVLIIELEKITKNPLASAYMRFCKRVYDYSQTCPKLIDALLKIHEFPGMTAEEKTLYFNLFVEPNITSHCPLFVSLLETYESKKGFAFEFKL